jgi:hypothetical protein
MFHLVTLDVSVMFYISLLHSLSFTYFQALVRGIGGLSLLLQWDNKVINWNTF